MLILQNLAYRKRHYNIGCSADSITALLSWCSTVHAYLKDVPDVDDESALERLDRKPTAISLDLQALNMIYLEDNSQEIRIGVWRETDNFACLSARGIVVHPD